MKKIFNFAFLLMFFVSFNCYANVAILIHGWLGDFDSWENSGVAQILDNAGWKRGGVFFYTNAQGVQVIGQNLQKVENTFYTVRLPSRTSIYNQTQYFFKPILDSIVKIHPNEKIILVGHSAGGVVARTAIVAYHLPQFAGLVTIATPNLGTPKALEGLDAVDVSFPFSMVSDFFGGSDYDIVKSSRPLLWDLVPATQGSYLYYLNNYAHPAIKYVSIVRGSPEVGYGDQLIPGFSQDLNNVPTLKGKAKTYYIPTDHFLSTKDGYALVGILKDM